MCDTFIYYINNNNTNNSTWFKNIFKDAICHIPNRVCSSKVIWNILTKYSDINNNFIKTKIFQETFSEYFKWKLLSIPLDDLPNR